MPQVWQADKDTGEAPYTEPSKVCHNRFLWKLVGFGWGVKMIHLGKLSEFATQAAHYHPIYDQLAYDRTN